MNEFDSVDDERGEKTKEISIINELHNAVCSGRLSDAENADIPTDSKDQSTSEVRMGHFSISRASTLDTMVNWWGRAVSNSTHAQNPLIGHEKIRTLTLTVLMISCFALSMICFTWYDFGPKEYRNTPFQYVIFCLLQGYMILLCIINAFFEENLREHGFRRKLRPKNAAKVAFLSLLVVGLSFIFFVGGISWNVLGMRAGLVVLCIVTHTLVASNYYNVRTMVEKCVQRTEIVLDLESGAVHFKHPHISSTDEILSHYKPLTSIRNWLTVIFTLDILTTTLFYVSLVYYKALVNEIQSFSILIFGLFMIIQTTSMYTVGQYNKFMSLVEQSNCNSHLMVRLAKWKPGEDVFLTCVITVVILLVNIMFARGDNN